MTIRKEAVDVCPVSSLERVYFLTEITAHAAKLGAVIFLFPLQ